MQQARKVFVTGANGHVGNNESIMVGGLKSGTPNASFPAVDIRDVIDGHIRAAESDATGRFIITVKGKEWTMSNQRARKELGWSQTIPLDQSVADTITTLKALRQQAVHP